MSDMSGAFGGHAFADAERVPIWTRPAQARFVAQPTGRGAGFSAWSSPGDGAPAPTTAPMSANAVEDIDALRAEAYALGFNEGHGAAIAALDAENAAFDALASAIANVRAEPPADLARLLSETVSRLVRQVVGEVSIDTGLLAERTLAVAAMVTEEGAPARLRLNPSDIARVEGLPTALTLVADPALAEGSVVAESAAGWIEDGPAIRLEKLRGLLDQMGCRR